MRYLITLTSPLAVRMSDRTTRVSNVVEADQITPKNVTPGMTWLRIFRVWDHSTQLMIDTSPIDVTVNNRNIRCRQEVAL